MTDIQARLQQALGDTYRVERELARGGMSQLFLATEASLGRQVVIKLLPPEMASEVSAARFRQEIEVAAHLQHPHVLPVLGTGARGDLIWFVMPYVAGESLRHRLSSEGRLPVDEALMILTEVADALAYAHERGVVHRDLKPENILLQQGHAVLTDFGVARAREQARAGERLTELGTAVGTPGYMSPEQAAGEREIDARADIYALAVVGYEMLAGEPPFTGPNAQAVLAAHLTRDPAPVHEVRPEVPANASRALQHALAKNPDDRFQTAAEFRDALRQATTGPVQIVGRPKPWGLAAAALGVLLVAGLAFALWPRGFRVEGDPRQSLVIFPFENKTGDASQDYLQEASMNLLGLAVSHWQDLRVYDDERTASLMRRRDVTAPAELHFDLAQDMAREARVGTLVLGDIRREGDSIAIEAKVHDTRSGDRLATEIVRAPWGTDPRPLFDSVAARILQVSGAPAGERPGLVAQTTSSLEAYRAYLRGTAALQRFDLDTAEKWLDSAVTLDSTFALAYLRLRDVAGWDLSRVGSEQRREWLARAQALSGRLPPRYRTLVQFHVAYGAGEMQRARELVSGLIARDSSDTEAWYQLGEAHYHDLAGVSGRSRGSGNLGKALRAFQRTLALDSSYMVAYQHTLDALAACAQNPRILCLADSSVTAAPDTLRQRYGAATVDRLTEAAAAERLRTARAWVAASPETYRARAALIQLLVQADRLQEARTEVAALEAGNRDDPVALVWRAYLTFRDSNFAEAGAEMRRAMARPGGQQFVMSGGFQQAALNVYAAAGMGETFDHFASEMIGNIPLDSVTGPEGAWFTPGGLLLFLRAGLKSGFGEPDAGPLTHAWLDTMVTHWRASEPAQFEALWSESGFIVLMAFLATRDTTLLARYLPEADTAATRTWRPMAAHLELARGDTAAVRRRMAYFRRADSLELAGSPGIARIFGWADLFARMGALEEALAIYGAVDRNDLDDGPGLRVRSWPERAALLQQLGREEEAAALYRRFLDAWANAEGQPAELVERVRAALETLPGTVRAPARR